MAGRVAAWSAEPGYQQMSPVLEITGILKDYHGLRPLRVRELTLSEREIVAIAGLDLPATETLTNLITGATLPDIGSIRVFGQDTSAIADADAWLRSLDRLGIVSDRVALLDTFSVQQNIALPLTLDLDELPPDTAAAVRDLARAVGLQPQELDIAAGNASSAGRLRTRLARALAPSPRLLLMEHPSASIPRADVSRVASDLCKLIRERGCAALIVSADRDFTSDADRQLVLDPATGALRRYGVRAWFP
jgi:ABC-type lipoprotein export system ATPase subunit